MDYDVTKSAMEDTFKVPGVIVDKYLKLSNPIHLQIILWMLRVGLPMSAAKVSEQLRIDRSIVNEAMFYWIDCGVLIPCSPSQEDKGDEPLYKAEIPDAHTEKKESEKQAPRMKSPAPKLGSSIASADELLKRAEESCGFKFILHEAEKIFGRSISRAEQSMLLSLMDNYGLPPEVIIMLITHCVNIGRKGTAYIQKTGEGWAEEGIFTIEAAEEKIAAQKKINKLWTELASRVGNRNPRPTKKQEEYLKIWNEKWHFDIEVIFLAYEEMADRCAKPSFAYVNKILERWHSEGIKTADDALKAQQSAADAAKSSSLSAGSPSYDIDTVEKNNKKKKLVYKKRG